MFVHSGIHVKTFVYSDRKRPNAIKRAFTNARKRLGGKGAGLVFASEWASKHKCLLTIPEFVIVEPGEVPAWYYVNRMKCKRVAVRSSASVSMPGLMDTVLDVEKDNAPDVLEKIRDSFRSEAAQHFLETIPEDKRPSGTAVVIQRMAEGDHFGVIFTASHNGFPDLCVLSSGKPGDIVGGSKNATRIELPEDIVSDLARFAEDWYKIFHVPPEFEYAYNSDTEVLYLLQVRDQKLSRAEKLALKGKLLTVRDGNVILEATGSGFARVKTHSDLVILHDANPETISEIIIKEKPKMIIWRRGSVFSHGAVLCRTAGIAYARVDDGVDILAPPFIFNEGTFYDKRAKVNIVDNKIASMLLDHIDNVDWSAYDAIMSDDSKMWQHVAIIDTNRLFTSAILAWKKYLFDGNPEDAMNAAKVIAILGFLAVYGEMRHASRSRLRDVSDVLYHDVIDTFALHGRLLEREDIYAYAAYCVRDAERVLSLAKVAFVARTRFGNTVFSSAYGGNGWKSIAISILKLVRAIKEMREKRNYVSFMRIVSVMNDIEHIEHNTSLWFNKFVASPSYFLYAFDRSSTYDEYVKSLAGRYISVEMEDIDSYFRVADDDIEFVFEESPSHSLDVIKNISRRILK